MWRGKVQGNTAPEQQDGCCYLIVIVSTCAPARRSRGAGSQLSLTCDSPNTTNLLRAPHVFHDVHDRERQVGITYSATMASGFGFEQRHVDTVIECSLFSSAMVEARSSLRAIMGIPRRMRSRRCRRRLRGCAAGPFEAEVGSLMAIRWTTRSPRYGEHGLNGNFRPDALSVRSARELSVEPSGVVSPDQTRGSRP